MDTNPQPMPVPRNYQGELTCQQILPPSPPSNGRLSTMPGSPRCGRGSTIYLEADGKFCCLGVLCHMLHQRPELGIEMDRFMLPDGTAEYSTPTRPRHRRNVPDSIADELGLMTKMPSKVHRAVEAVLVDLNDINGASFAEIAQFIEDDVMPLLRAKGVLPPAQQENKDE